MPPRTWKPSPQQQHVIDAMATGSALRADNDGHYHLFNRQQPPPWNRYVIAGTVYSLIKRQVVKWDAQRTEGDAWYLKRLHLSEYGLGLASPYIVLLSKPVIDGEPARVRQALVALSKERDIAGAHVTFRDADWIMAMQHAIDVLTAAVTPTGVTVEEWLIELAVLTGTEDRERNEAPREERFKKPPKEME